MKIYFKMYINMLHFSFGASQVFIKKTGKETVAKNAVLFTSFNLSFYSVQLYRK